MDDKANAVLDEAREFVGQLGYTYKDRWDQMLANGIIRNLVKVLENVKETELKPNTHVMSEENSGTLCQQSLFVLPSDHCLTNELERVTCHRCIKRMP